MLPNFSLTYLIILIVCILISLAIHEFMHAYAGYKLGDYTAKDEGRLTLNPLSHIDPIMTVALPIVTLLLFGAPVLAAKPVPFDPGNVRYGDFGAAIIAAAGPFTNLALAFIGAILLKFAASGAFMGEVLTIFVSLNVALFVFNMLPIPPLDGSRVLYAFAPEAVQDFMRQIEPFGLILIFGLIFVADLGGFIGNLNKWY
ncbi:MAG: site-2 protease family protein [Candidatus Saccharimonadales bacterium]